MELKVVNALSRDVEREQLNKILKYISDTLASINSGGITEAQVRALIAESIPVLPSQRPTTITITGDATGEGIGTTSISIPVELTGNFIEDAPSDSLPYWRQDGQWSMVPFPLLSLAYLSPSGFGAYNEEQLEWNSRLLTGTSGNITVTNGDGVLGDPVFDLATVYDNGAGSLLAITKDSYGRIIGTKEATITGTADNIVVTNGDAEAGVPTINLATVSDSGTGTLQLTAFDTFGRKTGTAAADTDDLAEGEGNLYFTDERVDARLAAAYRRGLYHDRPAAASVKNGSIFAAKDVKENYASDGVTWELLPSGGNELGYAERTSDFNAPAGTTVDVPGLSVTAVVGDGDVMVNFGGTLIMNMTAPNEYANLILYVDGAYASQLLARAVGGYIVVSRSFRVSGLTPGVAHTFKLGLQSIGALHAQLAAVNEDRPYIQVVTI